MNQKIMYVVRKICEMKSTDCRSLNKSKYARYLLNWANVPSNAEIMEIPLDWNNQVVILFTMPKDTVHKVNYYFELFAGIGTDGKLHFDLSKTGEWYKRGKWIEFDFYASNTRLPMNYFKV